MVLDKCPKSIQLQKQFLKPLVWQAYTAYMPASWSIRCSLSIHLIWPYSQNPFHSKMQWELPIPAAQLFRRKLKIITRWINRKNISLGWRTVLWVGFIVYFSLKIFKTHKKEHWSFIQLFKMHLIQKATGNLTQIKWKLKVIYYLLEVLLVISPITT